MNPKKITVRLVDFQMLIEFDDKQVVGTQFSDGTSEPENIMAALESVLRLLGYELDHNNLYMDMSLWVGCFYRKDADDDPAEERP